MTLNNNLSTAFVKHNESLSKVFHDATLYGDGTRTSPLRVLSGDPETREYTAVSATYSIPTSTSSFDTTVHCTANTFTVTLPTAIGATGKVYNIKNSGIGIITIATTSAQTIDGGASGSVTLNQYDNLTVQSDGANWIIL